MTNYTDVDLMIMKSNSTTGVTFDDGGPYANGYLIGNCSIQQNTYQTERPPEFHPTEEEQILSEIKRVITETIVPVVYFFLFVIGFLGNSLVLYVSCFLTKKAKSAVDIFVGNLALADLALLTTLPFWATTHMIEGVWVFNDIGCKIMSFLTHLSMFASIFFITAMAIDRYMVVVKAVKVRAKSLRTVSRAVCSCVTIWSFAVVLSLPAFVLRRAITNNNKTYCSWKYPSGTSDLWWALHIVLRNIIGFIVPVVIICRCYCVIVAYVKSRASSFNQLPGIQRNCRDGGVKNKQQQHVTRLVTTIIVAFVICWLPNQISNFCHSLFHFRVIPRPSTMRGNQYVYIFHVITTVLSFCNSVINPMIYSTSPSHRMHLKTLFRCINKKQRENEMRAVYHSIRVNADHSPVTGPRVTESTRLVPCNEYIGLDLSHSPIFSEVSQIKSTVALEPIRNNDTNESLSLHQRRPTGVTDSPPRIIINCGGSVLTTGECQIDIDERPSSLEMTTDNENEEYFATGQRV
uniref:somatostatin receptor type 5-like isoform X1 n=1 Tax=Styela clava TaxID=7725 RepID=UPI00193A1B01|nr:somatostatin receptor type 5-like isoform X1 [Styela clava]